jgi:signal transduction histidine kinase
VVTEVGGKIWLEESKLGGARFVVELPAAPEVTTVG